MKPPYRPRPIVRRRYVKLELPIELWVGDLAQLANVDYLSVYRAVHGGEIFEDDAARLEAALARLAEDLAS